MDTLTVEAELHMNIFAYWSRWYTARKLAHVRKIDPACAEAHERIAAIGGINTMMDEVRK